VGRYVGERKRELSLGGREVSVPQSYKGGHACRSVGLYKKRNPADRSGLRWRSRSSTSDCEGSHRARRIALLPAGTLNDECDARTRSAKRRKGTITMSKKKTHAAPQGTEVAPAKGQGDHEPTPVGEPAKAKKTPKAANQPRNPHPPHPPLLLPEAKVPRAESKGAKILALIGSRRRRHASRDHDRDRLAEALGPRIHLDRREESHDRVLQERRRTLSTDTVLPEQHDADQRNVSGIGLSKLDVSSCAAQTALTGDALFLGLIYNTSGSNNGNITQ
jgi:hypothetical protein